MDLRLDREFPVWFIVRFVFQPTLRATNHSLGREDMRDSGASRSWEMRCVCVHLCERGGGVTERARVCLRVPSTSNNEPRQTAGCLVEGK